MRSTDPADISRYALGKAQRLGGRMLGLARHHTTRSLAGLAIAAVLTVGGSAIAQSFGTSEWARSVDLPACDASQPDVAFIDSVEDWVRVNDPALRVFCVAPGEYRPAGTIRLERSGTSGSPRVLRYHDPASGGDVPHPHSLPTSGRAVIESLELIGASHWVVQGLAIQDAPIYGVRFEDANSNLLDRLMVQYAFQAQVRFRGTSSHNVFQNSLVRRSRHQFGRDSACVLFEDPGPGRRQLDNRLVQNEISDCSDGVQLFTRGGTALSEAGSFTGLVIDENDIHLTAARRTDCRGVLDADGPCACAEEAIDIKLGSADASAEGRVTISNNRIWGWREGDRGVSGDKSEPCGGTGSWGGGFTIHEISRNVAIVGNRVFDSSRGVLLGTSSRWIEVRDNLFHANDRGVVQPGFAVSVGGPDQIVTGNVMAESPHWLMFTERTRRATATCNVAVSSGPFAGNFPESGSEVDANTLHATPAGKVAGPNDVVLPDLSLAGGDVCFARRRWTSPETVCIPNAARRVADSLRSTCGRSAPAAPQLLN